MSDNNPSPVPTIAAVLFMLGLFVVMFVPWSCEKPADVARCVERCEILPSGCTYSDTHGESMNHTSRYCRCVCDWKLPLVPLDGGVD